MKSRIEVDPEKIKEIPMFFILGRPRSGTTLIRTLFDAHPDVCIPLETVVIPRLYPKYGHIKNWSVKNISAFCNDAMSLRYFSYWCSDKEKLKTDLLGFEKEHQYAELLKAFYLNYISFYEKNEIKLIGDKTPNNAVYLPLLLKIFPHAKFIHVIRDPREHILSLQKVKFGSNDAMLIAHNWKKVNKIIEKWKKRYPERFSTVVFEDFLCQPEFYAKKWCKFLSLEYSENMLRFYEKKDEFYNYYTPEELNKVHSSLMKPIKPPSGEGWKIKMKKSDLMIADYISGKYAERYGYKRMYSEFPLLWKIKQLPKKIYITFIAHHYNIIKRNFTNTFNKLYYRLLNA